MTLTFWWLILHVTLAALWDARIFGQMWFWVYLWGGFWMRLTLKSDWAKQVALCSVDGPRQSGKGRTDQKSSISANPLSLPDGLRAGTSVFSSLQTQAQIGMYTIGSPASQAFELGLEVHLWLSSCSSLLPVDLGGVSASIMVWANPLYLFTYMMDGCSGGR